MPSPARPCSCLAARPSHFTLRSWLSSRVFTFSSTCNRGTRGIIAGRARAISARYQLFPRSDGIRWNAPLWCRIPLARNAPRENFHEYFETRGALEGLRREYNWKMVDTLLACILKLRNEISLPNTWEFLFRASRFENCWSVRGLRVEGSLRLDCIFRGRYLNVSEEFGINLG